MKLIRPIAVTDAMLTSSSVPEADYPVWNAATAYTVGQRVIRTTGVHKVFERKVAGTTAAAPETDTINWLEVEATNRWRMFDYVVGSQTTAADSITVTLAPGAVTNSIAMLNADAKSVRIKCTSGATVLYDKTISLIDSIAITDWYYYFFEPISYRKDVIFLDLPTDSSMTVEVTITNTGGTAAVGAFVIGQSQDIGTTMTSASTGIKDYSRKETDTFGNYIIVPRAFSKRASFNIKIERRRIDIVQRLLTDLRTTPVVYVGSDDFESTIIYGFYRDFSIVIDFPVAECSLEIEGLT